MMASLVLVASLAGSGTAFTAGRPVAAQAPVAQAPVAQAPVAQAPTAQAPYVLGQELEPKGPGAAGQPGSGYQEGNWDLLVPKDWDPMKDLKGLDLNQLSDNDPRAMAALRKLQEAWKGAPVNQALNNTRIRIAGFVVPLDGDRNRMKEFLLVPYFGACIHVPPPPSNQIIHVVAPQGVKGLNTMDAVWVSGTLAVERIDTAMGSSGYRMSGDEVEPYSEPSPKK